MKRKGEGREGDFQAYELLIHNLIMERLSPIPSSTRTQLKRLMHEIIWGNALQIEETFRFPSHDDMMDDIVSDLSMFTEHSHHQNISEKYYWQE